MEKVKFVRNKRYFLRKTTITQTKNNKDTDNYNANKWFIEFRCACTSTSNVEHSKRPIEVFTSETIEKILDRTLADRRLRDHGSYRHITWLSGFDFERFLGYEQNGCHFGSQLTTNTIV